MFGKAKLDKSTGIIAAAWVAAAGMSGFVPQSANAAEKLAYVSVGENTRAPIGWKQFCQDHPEDCTGGSISALDVQLTKAALKEMERVNRYVNDHVKPMTDLDHYGVVEKWAYPDDGYGDCEDYVLLKRKMLMDAGWPREALLITVVRDKKGEGHAVLTVKTDKGEFVLDNQNENVVAWTETGYRFVKRQSQSDPNVWVSLGDARPAMSTASARDR